MSILIKGMDMPKSCGECPCCNGENGYCQLRKEYVYGEVPRSCPLIELPPHGRLIDADALNKAIRTDIMGGLNYEHFIETAPTIIESE